MTWQSSKGWFCSPCSQPWEHPTNSKNESYSLLYWDRVITQMDTWKSQHDLCRTPTAWCNHWEFQTLQVKLNLHRVAPNITTLLLTSAAIPTFYNVLVQVQIRHETTMKIKRISYFIRAFWRPSWGEVFQCLLYREDVATVMLNCRLQD